ncbi:DUF3488 and transglutaminase-like domain-containing protein [bacterium]|nr:DUF3488 and transglutaminase-like domain-containing protein [bacterium]
MRASLFKNIHFCSLCLSLAPLFYELPQITALVCAPLLLLTLLNRIQIPHWLLQTLAPLSGFFFYKTFGTLQTPEAASSLMCFVLYLKSLDVKSHRDMMMFLMMNLLITMFYLLFSQTLLSTFLLFVNYFLFIFFLLDLQKQKLGLAQDPFSLSQLLSIETLVALPLLISLFIFFPRFTTPWGGLGAATTQSVIGFSNELSPGQMQNLAESDLIAFRVLFKSKKIPSADQLYFRGSVLTENKGWQWLNSKVTTNTYSAPNSITSPDYEILLEPRFEQTLFTLEPTNAISLQPTDMFFSRSPQNTFFLRWPIQSKIKIAGTVGQNQPESSEENPFNNLEVNMEVSQRLSQLLEPIKKLSEKEKLTELLRFYQKSGFQYSTQTPAYANLDDFLFGEKIGFCEHFASSFAVLARLVGLPARVVIGFQGAEVNSIGSYLVVKDKHAHSWNEVYLPDVGWSRVDVTDLVAPARIRQGALFSSTDGQLRPSSEGNFLARTLMTWDALNYRFNLMLMNYNLENQMDLLGKIGLGRLNIKTVIYVFIFIILFFTILVWVLSFLGRQSFDKTTLGYQLLNKKLTQLGIQRQSHEGPLLLRKKILGLENKQQEILNLLDRYISLRFGPNATANETKRFYKDVKALKVL